MVGEPNSDHSNTDDVLQSLLKETKQGYTIIDNRYVIIYEASSRQWEILINRWLRTKKHVRMNGFPQANTELLWDRENMTVANYNGANRFVRRNYRQGRALES